MPGDKVLSPDSQLDIDASDTGIIAKFENLTLQHKLSESTITVLKRLKSEDIKKVIFLSLNFIPEDRYSIITKSEKAVSLFYLLQFLGAHVSDLESYVREVLFIIKKYRFLRDLGMCKHQAKVMFSEEKNGKVSNFWKMLFHLCEELEECSLTQLHNLCFANKEMKDDILSAEDLFFKLWCNKKISDKNVSLLISSLEEIRSDLAKIVKKYQSSLKYFIKNPSVNNPCGLAIIINQECFDRFTSNHQQNLPDLNDRKGSLIDCKRLDSIWKSFGFITEIQHNLKSTELISYFKEVSLRNHNAYDVFVACILSHGEKGAVYGSDRIAVKIEDLVFPFAKGKNTLCGKPKLFFIQACQTVQGHKGNLPNRIDSEVSSDSPFETVVMLPDLCDILWAMSTVPEYASFRHERQGSFYISELADTLEKCGDEEDIDSILRTVNRCIADKDFPYKGGVCKQMPEWRSTLRFKLQLKRLHFED